MSRGVGAVGGGGRGMSEYKFEHDNGNHGGDKKKLEEYLEALRAAEERARIEAEQRAREQAAAEAAERAREEQQRAQEEAARRAQEDAQIRARIEQQQNDREHQERRIEKIEQAKAPQPRVIKLVERVASHDGIERTRSFTITVNHSATTARAARATAARTATAEARTVTVQNPAQLKNTIPDSRYDGQFVGADGKTYRSSTALASIPAVQPANGRQSNETLIFINGINTDKARQSTSLQRLADATGAQALGVHNATNGAFADVIQSAGDTLDIGRNKAVDTLGDTVYNQIKQGQDVHLAAHSQGALITSRALTDVRNRLLVENFFKNPLTAARETNQALNHVKVETFGGAASYYPDGPQYVHYVNRRDPVPSAFGLADSPLAMTHAGRGAVVHYFDQAARAHDFDNVYLSERVAFDKARRNDFSR